MKFFSRMTGFYASLIWPSLYLLGLDFHDFDKYQNQLTQQQIEQKIQTYLEKSPSIRSYYSVSENELIIGDIAKQKIDYILNLTKKPQESFKNKKKLKGARIALDPGHYGGIFAKLEERFVELKHNDTILSFNEGTLTYLTALKLKSLLEEQGAIVFLTRKGIGQGCAKKSFFQWLESRKDLWSSSFSLSSIWRKEFNKIDLIARAEAINAFAPDLTLIIHYNASANVANKPPLERTSQANYNLVFIPGAFRDKDLSSIESRYEFLRLIVTDDCKESLHLSECITAALTKELDVPLISDTEKAPYEPNFCIKQGTGIYSRNLNLTRLIHSPLCYGETLIQNNIEEALRLSNLSNQVEGIPCSERVIEVATAYFKGIEAYFSDK